MPICRGCTINKPQDGFYRHPQMPSGYVNYCKECYREGMKKSRSKEKDRKRYRTSSRKRLNQTFGNMMRRCYDTNDTHYRWYGGRGIIVEWKSYSEFYNDMNESYMEHRRVNGGRQTQIDRIDNNGNYSKENCRWVTAKENNQHNK